LLGKLNFESAISKGKAVQIEQIIGEVTIQTASPSFYKTMYNKNMPGSENSTAIMFYYVYIVQSMKNKDLYVGFTIDLKKRLQEHNRGSNFSTKPYRPWKLIHFEAYINGSDAKRREDYLKTSQGSRVLKRMLKDYFHFQKSKN